MFENLGNEIDESDLEMWGNEIDESETEMFENWGNEIDESETEMFDWGIEDDESETEMIENWGNEDVESETDQEIEADASSDVEQLELVRHPLKGFKVKCRNQACKTIRLRRKRMLRRRKWAAHGFCKWGLKWL